MGRTATRARLPASTPSSGTQGPDTINAGLGNDAVCGLGGADKLFGQGGGGDNLVGGLGVDRLDGDRPPTSVLRGPGVDVGISCENEVGIP